MASNSPPSNIQRTVLNQIFHRLKQLTNQPGVHTPNSLKVAGFIYTGNADTTRCVDCGLEVSGWTSDMVPFTIHAQRSPHCRFVNAMYTPLTRSPTVIPTAVVPASATQETIPVHENATSANSDTSSNNLVESDQLKQTRQRSFSHWPRHFGPSARQMINAGLFYCNSVDRVICIYCDLICQEWTSDTEDPSVIHKKLSPGCCYVKAFLTSSGLLPIINDNSRLTIPLAGRLPLVSNNINSLVANGLIHITSQNSSSETDRMELIDDATQANYFNTNVIADGVCQHCGEPFRTLNGAENPMIDHARQYPNCPSVQQLQGVATYRPSRNAQSPLVWTKEMIRAMVATRLDWPVSRDLLNRNYSLFIVTQCWTDQLRLKGEDFVSDLDLKVACLVRRKQFEHIQAQKPMIIPRERMRQMRENEIRAQEDILEQIRATENIIKVRDQLPDLEPIHRCVACLSLKRYVAFLPCGHLVTCISCSDRVDTCPVCRGPKEAVVLVL